MHKSLKSVSLGLTGFFAVGVSFYALSYLFIEHSFLQDKIGLENYSTWQVFFHFHFIGGAVALILGWAQFWKWLRVKFLKLHRTTGMIYVGAILLLGAPGGIYAAFYAIGGFSNSVGFGMMGILWFITTLLAFTAIKGKNIESHKNWMIRSYALTLSAVTLRLWLPIFMAGFGTSFEEAYATVAWISWVPNLIIAEIIINRGWISL